MSWLDKLKAGIYKKATKEEDLWTSCKKCKEQIYVSELEDNLKVYKDFSDKINNQDAKLNNLKNETTKDLNNILDRTKILETNSKSVDTASKLGELYSLKSL